MERWLLNPALDCGLIVVEKEMERFKKDESKVKAHIEVAVSKNSAPLNILPSVWEKYDNQKGPILESIDQYVREYLKIAS